MILEFDQAVLFFEGLEKSLQNPYLHPAYVRSDAARYSDLKPIYFVYQEEQRKYYHAFHLSEIPGFFYKDIQSPYGYGGPISNTSDDVFLDRAWGEYVTWCKEQRVLVEFMRFHPLLGNYRYYRGQVMEDRAVVWVPLTEELWSGYRGRTRTAIKKAVNSGLRVEVTNARLHKTAFYQMYTDTMKQLNASDFYLFNAEYFEQLLEWANVRMLLCTLQSEVVGAAIFLLSGTYMEYHLSASNEIGRKLGATNLILHEAALFGCGQNYLKLHLGGGTNSDVNNPLLFFKQGFSKEKRTFYIGKHVFEPDAYDAMRRGWVQEARGETNRVLFYRF